MSKWLEYVEYYTRKKEEWWLCAICMIYEWQRSCSEKKKLNPKQIMKMNMNSRTETHTCTQKKRLRIEFLILLSFYFFSFYLSIDRLFSLHLLCPCDQYIALMVTISLDLVGHKLIQRTAFVADQFPTRSKREKKKNTHSNKFIWFVNDSSVLGAFNDNLVGVYIN